MQQYTVQPNDSLYLIAKKFKIPLAQLIKANPEIDNQNQLYIGQIITIPDLPPAPEQLDVIEINAENILGSIYTRDWQGAMSRANVIGTNLNELMPLLQQALVPNRLIADLQRAARSLESSVALRNSLQALYHANQITRYIPDILDYFNVIVPTDAGRLRHLGRQIIFDVNGNDWAGANATYLTAKTVWNRLKPSLNISYGSDITNFDQALSSIHDSIGRKDYQTALENANIMLDLVDVLRADFIQQNANKPSGNSDSFYYPAS
jgi:LysM repeat protein